MSTLQRTWKQLWTRDSSILLGGFLVTVILIVYIWWPLAEEYLKYVDWDGAWWRYIDWLLLGIFGFMSITVISHANLKTDLLIIFVGVCGGLAIESWGTQTNLWYYYTAERPPLWIIPAWPIASLSIDRITRFLTWLIQGKQNSLQSLVPQLVKAVGYFPDFQGAVRSRGLQLKLVAVLVSLLYWLTFTAFFILMVVFVAPTLDKSYTWLSLILCILLILTPTDHRFALLTFLAGAGLGYFLELWGTTRECWTYYTLQKPPLFAVLAHGMAAVAFWRAGRMMKTVWERISVSGYQQAEPREEL